MNYNHSKAERKGVSPCGNAVGSASPVGAKRLKTRRAQDCGFNQVDYTRQSESSNSEQSFVQPTVQNGNRSMMKLICQEEEKGKKIEENITSSPTAPVLGDGEAVSGMLKILKIQKIAPVYHRPWTDLSSGTSAKNTPLEQFKQEINVNGFAIDDIRVIMKNRCISIDAKTGKQNWSSYGWQSRQLKASLVIPWDYDINQVVLSLLSNGILCHNCSKKWHCRYIAKWYERKKKENE